MRATAPTLSENDRARQEFDQDNDRAALDFDHGTEQADCNALSHNVINAVKCWDPPVTID